MAQEEIVTLGGGCFWCIEAVFENIEGIISVVSGYSGGTTENPTYQEVCNETTGHAEVVRVSFNPETINFDTVLALAFEHHLAIAKNIPLEDGINWITSLAPKGIIEFVPKNDVTIQSMMRLKGDIFPNYNLENFKRLLSNKTKITSEKIVSKSGRTLFCFEK